MAILVNFEITVERQYPPSLASNSFFLLAGSCFQGALERVRARTMAMQQSTALPEAANLLFLQLQALGMPAWSAGYCIWEDDKKAVTLWMSSEGVRQPGVERPERDQDAEPEQQQREDEALGSGRQGMSAEMRGQLRVVN